MPLLMRWKRAGKCCPSQPLSNETDSIHDCKDANFWEVVGLDVGKPTAVNGSVNGTSECVPNVTPSTQLQATTTQNENSTLFGCCFCSNSIMLIHGNCIWNMHLLLLKLMHLIQEAALAAGWWCHFSAKGAKKGILILHLVGSFHHSCFHI